MPKPELSTEEIEFPQKVLYKGQVVKCQVLAVHPEQEKMVLSFKVSLARIGGYGRLKVNGD